MDRSVYSMAQDPRTDRDATHPITVTTDGETDLRTAQDRFIELWGTMGSSWGIQRSMAEVHALLFIVGQPLNTDEIMERLQISRGGVSMSLRALVEWGVVGRVHKRGERKEYFEAEQDVWQMFRIILRERKRREVDPVLSALSSCRYDENEDVRDALADDAPATDDVADHNRRVDEMMEFIELIDSLSERFMGPSGKGLRFVAGLLGKAV